MKYPAMQGYRARCVAGIVDRVGTLRPRQTLPRETIVRSLACEEARTNRSTINSRRSHPGEKSTVETAIAAADGLPTDCRVQLGCFVGGFQSEAPARQCLRQVLGNGGGCSHREP